MTPDSAIDVSFDVRTDSGGKDPDSASKTLRRYHRLLWSKPLPDGRLFTLDADLHHESELGEFWMRSDAISHTYSYWKGPECLRAILDQAPADEIQALEDLGCTVGAYTVFPSQALVDGKWRHSINQARGTNWQIRDRFDLTLECIRRHYSGEGSPLTGNLAYYDDWLALFGDFRGYVDFFLLKDLVADSYDSVRFFTEFDDFARDPLPSASVAEYREYLKRSVSFITARNRRIANRAANEDDR